MSFIDENCVIFDNEEENKIEYTDVRSSRCPRCCPRARPAPRP